MKQKLVALFMITVMVASALTAVSLATTTSVAAAKTTQTVLSASNTKPTVGESVTFTATLMNGPTPLSGKSITIYHYLNNVRYTDTTKTTNQYGQITLTQKFSSAGPRIYYAKFAGNSAYQTSTSSLVTVNVGAPTSIQLTATTNSPTVGESVTFIATLTSGTTKLSSKTVTIYHYFNGVMYIDTTKTTDINGQITLIQSFSTKGQRIYYATFAGNSKYGSSSDTVTVNVGTKSTTTTMAASRTAPTIGQSVTFTASLKSDTTPLSGKSITIYHYSNGVRYTDVTKTTNAYGKIAFAQTFGSTGVRTYYATFRGDSSYATSTSVVVTVTVNKIPTTLSPTSAVTANATVGQKFSLNGYLQDKYGNGLAGQKIGIYWLTSDTPSVAWKTVYTDSSGYYQCDVFSDKLATEQYQAKFVGDSQYLPKDSAIWVVTWKFQPQLSLQASSSSLSVGQTVTFTGYLKNQTGFRPGEPLRNRIVTLYWRNDPNSDWNKGPTTTTDQNGYYSFSTSSDVAQTVYYYVSYGAGQQTPSDINTYWNVDTNEVTVTWA